MPDPDLGMCSFCGWLGWCQSEETITRRRGVLVCADCSREERVQARLRPREPVIAAKPAARAGQLRVAKRGAA